MEFLNNEFKASEVEKMDPSSIFIEFHDRSPHLIGQSQKLLIFILLLGKFVLRAIALSDRKLIIGKDPPIVLI
jgi:hypothetical protein